ncbi:hypothetical protein J3R82DRAFT_9688 [Butyriboletus roseoflavus]|nr:hypothetical protein J3R82DRAFT_9688 [Butyriboletus roseoflavus]
MLMETQLSHVFCQLTKSEIKVALHSVWLSRHENRTRQALFEAVHYHEPSHEMLTAAIVQKKCKIKEDEKAAIKHVRLDQQNMQVDLSAEEDYMKDIGNETWKSCVEEFIDHTSNNAMCQSACAVCGGEFFSHEMVQVNFTTFQSDHILRPSTPHPCQQLVNGMLLYTLGLMYRNDHIIGCVCTTCQMLLEMGKTPPCSLSNGL